MVQTSPLNAEKQALPIWHSLLWQHRIGMAGQALLLTAIAFMLIDMVYRLFYPGYGMPLFLAFSLGSIWLAGIHRRFSENHLITELNHRYKWLEFSAALIPVEQIALLPQLQRERVLQILTEKRSQINALPDFSRLLMIFAGVMLLYAGWQVWMPKYAPFFHTKPTTALLPVLPKALVGKLPAMVSLHITVQAPAYTQQPLREATEPALEAPEGSLIRWQCQLSQAAEAFQVIWNGTDTVQVNEKNPYPWQRTLKTSAFYQFRYGSGGNWFVSPLYTLRAIEDQPPVITVQTPAPYTLVLYGQKPEVNVTLRLSDDYSLHHALLRATVSRGSGEAVKFRETELAFAENIIGRKEAVLHKRLDFKALKMEPGDELYFYAEATDQGIVSQKVRSDMYFVQWEDTTSQKVSVLAGLSLDNMPAYFRSERQIIIDTEKLISERKKLTQVQFSTRANDLGIDQKVLRLRHGQFLGEEFETTIGNNPGEASHNHRKQTKQDKGLSVF